MVLVMNEKIYVCYASSNEYAEYTGISIFSLLKNNAQYIRKVFILDYGILSENKEKINHVISSFHVDVEYIRSKEVLEELQATLNIKAFRSSLATYSRAFIDYIIPSYVDKLLYIDSDTVVNGNIEELIEYDMGNKVLAGSISLDLYDGLHSTTEFPLLSGNKAYIGCGIVLYSLENWRLHNCRQMIQTSCEKLETARFADQTVINNAIPEKLLGILPPKYNYAGHTFSVASERINLHAGGWYREEEIDQAVRYPVIIHYKGGPLVRPWFDDCQSRQKEVYYSYKEQTPWAESQLISTKEVAKAWSQKEKIEYKYGKIIIRQKYYFFEKIIKFSMHVEMKIRHV
ncbi:MAG: hypothetical protein LUE29_01145 [Lachnospiraceae bacterium]|nr:hypothetical protein [Lachnospiraceae bacterium]